MVDRDPFVHGSPTIMNVPTIRSLALLAALLASPIPAAPGGAAAADGATHALLINGGDRPSSNYQSHFHHLEGMVERLVARGIPRERIDIFSADGEGSEPDLAVRDARPSSFWLVEGTGIGKSLRPQTELTDTSWPGMTLRPARTEALKKWFREVGRKIPPGDRLLLFVTDHGTRNDQDLDDGAISLWQEKLKVRELEELLALLHDGVRTVMVMSQCYSGTFAAAMDEEGQAPSGDVCGFFSTARDLRAYGCYPEGQDRDRIGHAFRFIDALERHGSTDAAHREVLITDDTPDVPLRTSDLYMAQVLEAAARSEGVSPSRKVDGLLAEAWRDRAAWEPEIRLLDCLGEVYGLFSPRSLSELESYESEFPRLIERMDNCAKRWELALVGLKEENLRSLKAREPEWDERLGRASSLDPTARRQLLMDLLPPLEWNAQDDSLIRGRLEFLRDRSLRASEARWRLEVRQAVVRRMRSILEGIAGRVLLADVPRDADAPPDPHDASRRALRALQSCEALEPGKLSAPDAVSPADLPPSYPPLADDIALLETIVPSWLGVQFGDVPSEVRAGRELPAGATWIRAVYPDSPGEEAGMAAGDVVLGPPGEPFHAPGRLREWTMTAPVGSPLTLVVLRPAVVIEEDREFETTLFLRPFPEKLPALPGPPKVGQNAPPLADTLRPVNRLSLPDLDGRSYLVVFWATWCLPCKNAVPEILAYASSRKIPVVAISEEDEKTVRGYLDKRQEAFFEYVAVDPLRRTHIDYGVGGTPTIILVSADAKIAHRQVGYKPADGLKIEGWSWQDDGSASTK